MQYNIKFGAWWQTFLNVTGPAKIGLWAQTTPCHTTEHISVLESFLQFVL